MQGRLVGTTGVHRDAMQEGVRGSVFGSLVGLVARHRKWIDGVSTSSSDRTSTLRQPIPTRGQRNARLRGIASKRPRWHIHSTAPFSQVHNSLRASVGPLVQIPRVPVEPTVALEPAQDAGPFVFPARVARPVFEAQGADVLGTGRRSAVEPVEQAARELLLLALADAADGQRVTAWVVCGSVSAHERIREWPKGKRGEPGHRLLEKTASQSAGHSERVGRKCDW